MKKRFIGIAIVSIALCLSGCGNSAGSSVSYSEETYDQVGNSYAAKEAAYDSYAEEAAVDAGGYMMEGDAADTDNEESALRAQDGQKIVYTGSLSIQTLEYDKSAASIRRKIREAGGFSEAESENDNDYNWYRRSTGPSSTRNLNITARIPSEKFESFMDSLQGDGKVMNRSMNAENISQVYANKETYKKALEKEQERLLAMMDKAVTIEDMIAVESRLSEVERQLNTYKTDLSAMDKDVQYSTIYISLEEVKRYSDETPTVTFPEKVKYAFEDAINSFTEFCEGIVLFIIRSFPFLILLAIVIALVIRLIRKRQEKRIAMMSDPEYAKMVSEKAKAKAKADAAKRDAREAKRQSRGGLFGKKKNDIVPSTHDVAEEKTDTKPDENSGE
jgi:Na+-transporting methylmalonyl-CoA/oxaloacetate decarboxylase gamma subunit/phosphopantetheinyl transferase (holo-ACP synthase)